VIEVAGTFNAVSATELTLGSLQITRAGTYLVALQLFGSITGIGASSVSPLSPPPVGATIEAAIEVTGNVDSALIQIEPDSFICDGFQISESFHGGDTSQITSFQVQFINNLTPAQSFGRFVAKADTSASKPVTVTVTATLTDIVGTVDAVRTTLAAIIQASVDGFLSVFGPIEAIPLSQFR
jgi:hypothetical protein